MKKSDLYTFAPGESLDTLLVTVKACKAEVEKISANKSTVTKAKADDAQAEYQLALSRYNAFQRKRVFDLAIKQDNPFFSMARTYHCPQADTAGRFPSVRLSVYDYIDYCNTMGLPCESERIEKAIDNLTNGLKTYVLKSVTNSAGATISITKLLPVLQNVLEAMGMEARAYGKDIRFLTYAITRAGRNLGTISTMNSRTVAKYLTDICHLKATKSTYHFETKEEIDALLNKVEG